MRTLFTTILVGTAFISFANPTFRSPLRSERCLRPSAQVATKQSSRWVSRDLEFETEAVTIGFPNQPACDYYAFDEIPGQESIWYSYTAWQLSDYWTADLSLSGASLLEKILEDECDSDSVLLKRREIYQTEDGYWILELETTRWIEETVVQRFIVTEHWIHELYCSFDDVTAQYADVDRFIQSFEITDTKSHPKKSEGWVTKVISLGEENVHIQFPTTPHFYYFAYDQLEGDEWVEYVYTPMPKRWFKGMSEAEIFEHILEEYPSLRSGTEEIFQTDEGFWALRAGFVSDCYGVELFYYVITEDCVHELNCNFEELNQQHARFDRFVDSFKVKSS